MTDGDRAFKTATDILDKNQIKRGKEFNRDYCQADN